MAIRHFKQIGVTERYNIECPVFSEPIPPVKPGDTVVLKYDDGRIDTVLVQQAGGYVCASCSFDKKIKCPAYAHNDGRYYCMFGEGLYGVSIDNILEEL